MSNILSNKELIKHYCIIRLKQEKELSDFQKQEKSKIECLKHELSECAISIRRIQDAIRMVNNFDDFDNFTFNENISRIYDLIVSSLGENSFTFRYTECENQIRDYIEKSIGLKNKINDFKKNQSLILKEISDDITLEGIPMYIIRDRYSVLKTQLKFFEIEAFNDPNYYYSEEVQNYIKTSDEVFADILKDIILSDETDEPLKPVEQREQFEPPIIVNEYNNEETVEEPAINEIDYKPDIQKTYEIDSKYTKAKTIDELLLVGQL